DIDKGAISLDAINNELKDARFGIVCLTPENLSEKWIHFEAGAIARTVIDGKSGRLWTFLLGLTYKDVQGPLAQFQHTVSDMEDILELVRGLVRKETDKRELEQALRVMEKAIADSRAGERKAVLHSIGEVSAALKEHHELFQCPQCRRSIQVAIKGNRNRETV